MAIKNVPAQAPRIGIADMVDPTLHAGIKFCKSDCVALVGVNVAFQAAGEVDGVALLQLAVRRVDDETQPRDAVLRLYDLRFAFVGGQAQACQPLDD